MTIHDQTMRGAERRAGRRRAVCLARVVGLGFGGLAGLVIVAVSGLYLALAAGPISLGGESQRVQTSLASRLGPGWQVTVTETAIELMGLRPAIRMTGLDIKNPVGVTVVRAPHAVVSLNPVSLLVGVFSPREIELRDLHLRGVIAQDGSLSFSTPEDVPPIAPPSLPAGDDSGTVPPSATVADLSAPSIVAAAASSLVRPLVAPSGLIGALDRAKLIDARLSLVGADGRERVAFEGVDALFEKVAHDDRRFEIDLRGQRGEWRVAGTVSGTKGHATTIEAHRVPVADLMLLSGLSKVPATSDIKLSGSLSASFGRDRLAQLDARLTASPGRIERKGLAPLHLDDASAAMKWDEATKSLNLASLRIRGEGTDMDLRGEIAAGGNGAWRLALQASDVVVADLDARKPPFKVTAVDAAARIEEGVVSLDRFSMRGDRLDVSASGTFAPGATDRVLAAQLDVRHSDARQIVRIWPDGINRELRAYLAKRLLDGNVETLRLRTTFDMDDLRAAFSERPLSDKAVEFSLSTSGTALAVVDGLPPLRDLAVQSRATGTAASITASGGVLEMPDGRHLDFTDASYLHTGLDKPGTAAKIGFRVRGGFDALASLMRAPLIRDAGAPELDPSSVRGYVDLRASLPLVPGEIPALPELGIEVAGTLSDIGADKLPGREKIEGGQFTLQQEAGALAIKGEGKLSGSPATFDLRVPKAGTGELIVTATLDEAARARRSLPVAPALTGPVGVRISVPLGTKLVPRVEADLSRAAIDGLVPGWQKAASRPARVAFTLVDGAATELRDLTVDAGPVQMKGSAVLSNAGTLERADVSTLRLSPGDDLRAQLERVGGVYRLAIRGNNADARPLLKWFNAQPAKGVEKTHDTEIDLTVAILSGFNDEAMTSVTAKASSRGGELRSFQFGGKFRSTSVEAALAKRDAGTPILSIRAGDAGAALRFLDLYRRMTGGRLALEARMGEGVQQGQITIEEFGLRGEPALRRIVSQSQQGNVGTDERGAAPVSRQDVDQVLFTRLTTGFRRAGSRIDYTDAVIYGAQIGFNLSGWVDTVRERLDINGTFVPAYLLNNAFSQLPVVGMILGGGRTEGLIAVDFRVAGSLSGPNVTVNPLTAVAPGILRKLFGWMMPEGQQGEPAETSTATEAAAAARRRTR